MSALLRARNPLLWIVTREEARAERYLIGPYRHYRTEDDLLVFDQCATDKHIPAARYYECFVFESDDDEDAPPSTPHAKKKMRAKAIAKHR